MTIAAIRRQFNHMKAAGRADTLRVVFRKTGEVRGALVNLRSRTVWRWPEGFHSPMARRELTTHNWSGRVHYGFMGQGYSAGFEA